MDNLADVSRNPYDLGFQDGYMACKNEYKKKARECRKQQIEAREKFLYFLKQKLLGVLSLSLTAVSIWLLDGDATIGVIMIPIGVALIFSNKPLIYGEYCWKGEEYE